MQKHDLTFVRGDDVSYRLSFLLRNQTPVDLAGARLDLHARADESDVPVFSLSSEDSSIEIQANGRAVIHIRHEMTHQAEWTRAKYDLQLTQNGKRTTILYGTVKLIADQTRI